MIVPMKKLSLIVLDSEKDTALSKLRHLGVVHIEQTGFGSEQLTALRQKDDTLVAALSILSEFKVATDNSSDADGFACAEETVRIFEERKNQLLLAAETAKTLEKYAGWGDIDPADFALLAKKGVPVTPYRISAKEYAALPDSVQTVCVSNDGKQVRFLLWGTNADQLPDSALLLELPPCSTNSMRQSIDTIMSTVRTITARLQTLATCKQAILLAKTENDKDIAYETARAGMLVDSDSSVTLAALQGYVPTDDIAAVTATAKTSGWALAVRDPADDDNVPTKVKNNKLVSLIYPVSDFLGTVPGYREYDISGWFLLFFCIFFGMIFGDAGYGVLLMLAGIGLCAKSGKGAPAPRLLILLGLATTAWGAVTCTWFGLDTAVLPSFLRNISLAPISNVTAAQSPESEQLVKQNLQVFCFVLALVQLSVAHLKGIVRYIKSPKFLGELGSLLMLWGMFSIVLSMVVSAERFPIAQTSLMMIAVGFGLSFIFSNYDGNLLASVLESCKNIVSVLLGVVNVFSDIVSYIRLWAVGMAGAAISSTVNQMAGPTLGGFLVFAGILLLVFGHGLNMILNVLSVIVHGVRLNTLEFSSHLGMSWSGFKYEPFSETVKK